MPGTDIARFWEVGGEMSASGRYRDRDHDQGGWDRDLQMQEFDLHEYQSEAVRERRVLSISYAIPGTDVRYLATRNQYQPLPSAW
eukprot:552288-Rhodomonas_salina.1